MKKHFLSFLLVALAVLTPAGAAAQARWFGEVSVESRAFPGGALAEEQHETNFALAARPEWYYAWDDGYQSITVAPFFRLDLGDPERTHFDLRELYWERAARTWELRVGVARVFWGVTESAHLVDVINQTDLVENPDGEDKLGQPMVNFTWIRSWGTLDLYLLPYFRERTFPGRRGRLRTPIPVASGEADYESDAGRWHPGVALRWARTLGAFDVGVAHFYGTSREPRFRLDTAEATAPRLVPYYDVIHQTSVDVQAIHGAWIWKLEAFTRVGQGDAFAALAAGFEYTFSNVRNTGLDVGVLAEYLYDGRDEIALGTQRVAATPFEDDLFLGARLAFNDVQSTEMLAGTVVDRDTGTMAVFAEAGRRLGDRWRLELEVRGFTNTSTRDALYSFRRDDYVQLELTYHF